jgi:hypothetical protein
MYFHLELQTAKPWYAYFYYKNNKETIEALELITNY